ncbi:glycosyltransferase family 4 protein [Tsuneonella litorea]|nr:glycosyltransferase family 4 protein [Tsuneonella litorea]
MRILFFTDNFPPETNAPASRTYEHAVRWVRAGHQVQVITCAPNFPTGKVFPGYRNRFLQRETIDGIEVTRVWTFMSSNSGFTLRLIDYFSFMFMAALIAPFQRRPDIVIGTSPQFFTLPAAWFAAKVKRVPWILELRDLWPESVKTVGAMNDSLLIRLAERLEIFLYRGADRIVTVTHAFKRVLQERGIDGGKISVVTNGVDLSRYAPRPRDGELVRKLALEGKTVGGYVGTHGMAHGLCTLLDAAEIAQSDPALSDLVLLFVGDGAHRRELEASAAKRGISNVRFVGAVSKQDIARYWSLLDFSIVHLKDDPLFTTVIPSKIFECMGMGIPMLMGVKGEALEIIEQTGSGMAFAPEDAADLVARMSALVSDPALRDTLARQSRGAAPDFDRNALASRLLEVIEEAVQAGDR